VNGAVRWVARPRNHRQTAITKDMNKQLFDKILVRLNDEPVEAAVPKPINKENQYAPYN